MTGNVEMANDEGSDPATDLKGREPKARAVADTDPKKTEKLAKAGRPDRDPDAGSD